MDDNSIAYTMSVSRDTSWFSVKMVGKSYQTIEMDAYFLIHIDLFDGKITNTQVYIRSSLDEEYRNPESTEDWQGVAHRLLQIITDGLGYSSS